MRGPDNIEPRRWLPERVAVRTMAVVLGLAVALAGCSAAPVPRPGPGPSVSVPSVSIPDDGITLAKLGFTHGPVTAWSLPQPTTLTGRVDQPNQLTMIVTSPGPADVVHYLAGALPTAGFTVEQQREDGDSSALIATGYGWRGSVIGASSGRTVITLQQVT